MYLSVYQAVHMLGLPLPKGKGLKLLLYFVLVLEKFEAHYSHGLLLGYDLLLNDLSLFLSLSDTIIPVINFPFFL